MDLVIDQVRVPIEEDSIGNYLDLASQQLQIPVKDLQFVKILFKSLDSKNKDQFFYKLRFVVRVPDRFSNKSGFLVYKEEPVHRQSRLLKDRPIIVGFGIAGIFAALELIEYGFQPIIFERGKKIKERSFDVQKYIRAREFNENSNIQFGEGGAGAYSDGKLFSRPENTRYVYRMFDHFIKFGAPEDIRYMEKPHIGTEKICSIVRRMSRYIMENGGEIHYNSKVTDLIVLEGKALGLVIDEKKEFRSSLIYLAIGHSARDTFRMIHDRGVYVEQKEISVGVRIEHPVETINTIRYGKKYKDSPLLGAAPYSFNYTNRKKRRGVYSFCMCPGGEVLNASSEKGMLAINGMSYSMRSSPFSNSGLVVNCRLEDYPSEHPLAGIDFQEKIESQVFRDGGGEWKVPAQNLLDYLSGKSSQSLLNNSYKMGTVSADLRAILPSFAHEILLEAFDFWKKDYPLYVSEQGILLGVETRTTSPIKIKRKENGESVNIENLYPIGEGSGYTGGITSSAADAIRAVELTVSDKTFSTSALVKN